MVPKYCFIDSARLEHGSVSSVGQPRGPLGGPFWKLCQKNNENDKIIPLRLLASLRFTFGRSS